MNKWLWLLVIVVAITAYGIGYLDGGHDTAKRMKQMYDCRFDRECLEAAGGNAKLILE